MKADPRRADHAERSRVARSAGLPLAAGNATPLSRMKKAYRTIKCYRNDMHNLCGLYSFIFVRLHEIASVNCTLSGS